MGVTGNNKGHIKTKVKIAYRQTSLQRYQYIAIARVKQMIMTYNDKQDKESKHIMLSLYHPGDNNVL